MKKLFVSFTSLLALVSAKQLTAEDLAEGLFFFGCWREHAFNPGAGGEFNPLQYKPAYATAHEIIKPAILLAEAEGRAQWHNGRKRSRSPWSLLEDLFGQNGVSILQNRPAGDAWVSYSYPAVRDAVTAAGLPLEVVY